LDRSRPTLRTRSARDTRAVTAPPPGTPTRRPARDTRAVTAPPPGTPTRRPRKRFVASRGRGGAAGRCAQTRRANTS